MSRPKVEVFTFKITGGASPNGFTTFVPDGNSVHAAGLDPEQVPLAEGGGKKEYSKEDWETLAGIIVRVMRGHPRQKAELQNALQQNQVSASQEEDAAFFGLLVRLVEGEPSEQLEVQVPESLKWVWDHILSGDVPQEGAVAESQDLSQIVENVVEALRSGPEEKKGVWDALGGSAELSRQTGQLERAALFDVLLSLIEGVPPQQIAVQVPESLKWVWERILSGDTRQEGGVAKTEDWPQVAGNVAEALRSNPEEKKKASDALRGAAEQARQGGQSEHAAFLDVLLNLVEGAPPEQLASRVPGSLKWAWERILTGNFPKKRDSDEREYWSRVTGIVVEALHSNLEERKKAWDTLHGAAEQAREACQDEHADFFDVLISLVEGAPPEQLAAQVPDPLKWAWKKIVAEI